MSQNKYYQLEEIFLKPLMVATKIPYSALQGGWIHSKPWNTTCSPDSSDQHPLLSLSSPDLKFGGKNIFIIHWFVQGVCGCCLHPRNSSVPWLCGGGIQIPELTGDIKIKARWLFIDIQPFRSSFAPIEIYLYQDYCALFLSCPICLCILAPFLMLQMCDWLCQFKELAAGFLLFPLHHKSPWRHHILQYMAESVFQEPTQPRAEGFLPIPNLTGLPPRGLFPQSCDFKVSGGFETWQRKAVVAACWYPYFCGDWKEIFSP